MDLRNLFPILMAYPENCQCLTDSERAGLDSLYEVNPTSFRSCLECIAWAPARKAALAYDFATLLKIGTQYKFNLNHCDTPSYGEVARRLEDISKSAEALGKALKNAGPWAFARIAMLPRKDLQKEARRGERLITLQGATGLQHLRIQLLALFALADEAAKNSKSRGKNARGAKSIAEEGCISGGFPSRKEVRISLFQACIRAFSNSRQDFQEAKEIARAIHAWASGSPPLPEWGKREWDTAVKSEGLNLS